MKEAIILRDSESNTSFKLEITEFSNNETDSLIELPLPQYTLDSQTSSRTDVLPLEQLKRPLYSASLNSSFTQNPKFFSIVPKKNVCLIESKTDTSKIFCKQRNGGFNLVNVVKKKTGNSYLARKEKYIKEMQRSCLVMSESINSKYNSSVQSRDYKINFFT